MTIYTVFTILSLLLTPISAVTGGSMQVEVTILENPEENQTMNNHGESDTAGSLNSTDNIIQMPADIVTVNNDMVSIEDEKAPSFKNFIKNTIWFLTGDKDHTPISNDTLFFVSIGFLLILLLIILLILLITVEIIYKRGKRIPQTVRT